MITLRNGSAAFLSNGSRVLLMKRAANRKIAPGVWSGVGGHIEPKEMNDPLAACYREIWEETGIRPTEITELGLRYIIIRRSKNEIRQSYIYFGTTTKTDTIQTHEGELHWIHKSELLNREYTKTFTEMLKHYTARKPDEMGIYIGAAENLGNELHMNWSLLEDFE